MLGDVTWEPLSSWKDLEALDVYLELWGAKAPRDLSRCEQAQWMTGHTPWHTRIYAVTAYTWACQSIWPVIYWACSHCNKSWGALAPHSSRYASRASRSLQELRSSHVMSPNIHLTCNSKSLLVHLWANISLTSFPGPRCSQSHRILWCPSLGTIYHCFWYMATLN